MRCMYALSMYTDNFFSWVAIVNAEYNKSFCVGKVYQSKMSSSNPNKKMKFTDENVDAQEKQFKLEHGRAMGYIPHE